MQIDCYIDIQKELPAKDPLLVTSEGELWTTTGSKLEFSKGKSGYAICSGSKNSFVKGIFRARIKKKTNLNFLMIFLFFYYYH